MPDSPLLSGFLSRGSDAATLIGFRRGEPQYFRDLQARAQAWRTAFEAAPGRRYLLHSTDTLEFAAMLFGAWQAGKCALVPSDLQAGAAAQLGVPVDGHAGAAGGLAAGEPSSRPWLPLDPEQPLLEMFTSGSTGHPLGIPKVLRQLDQELAGLAATLELGPRNARVLGTVSHQHMYGIVFRLLLPLVTGRPFEAQRLTQVHDLARLPAPEGCVLVSSPAQLARLPAGAQAGSRIHALLSAGGPLGEDAAQACRAELGVVPTEIYGSSETGAVAWRRRGAGGAGAWQALPGVAFRAEDGLLQIRARQLPTMEWFRSADRVVMTDSGFELAGRSDRIVKLEEKRVSLDAVERVLLDCGLLHQARALVLEGARPALAVIAMPSAAGWELAAQGKPRLAEELTAHLRRSVAAEILPRAWRFVDPWPVTADGKSPESLLRARFDRRIPEFRLLERDAAGCVVELWVSPTTPYFNGHFPGQPVLPGVAQIDWLVWLARELLGMDGGFAGLDAAKFKRIIRPGSSLRVHLANDATRTLTSYRIMAGEDLIASGRIRWGAA
jgi:acyl-CoA synthetase (AMP-forming)/AMP-acid ligase II/3-hydroxymyristoyl/3-hydroxydecanoyl-(acyl carrier protein) dehydratase